MAQAGMAHRLSTRARTKRSIVPPGAPTPENPLDTIRLQLWRFQRLAKLTRRSEKAFQSRPRGLFGGRCEMQCPLSGDPLMNRFAPALLALALMPAAAQAASTLPGNASSLTEAHDDWTVRCTVTNNVVDCAAQQEQISNQNKQRVLAIEVQPGDSSP